MAGSLKIHHLDAAADEFASLIGMRSPDVLYHLATIPRPAPTSTALARSFAVTTSVVEAARQHGVEKIVVALPASALYGRPASRDLPLKERPLEPRGVRGVIARATVDLLAAYREHEALEFTALALANVYGSRQRADGGVVASFRHAARDRRSPTIAGDGRRRGISCSSTTPSMPWPRREPGGAGSSSTSAPASRHRSTRCGRRSREPTLRNPSTSLRLPPRSRGSPCHLFELGFTCRGRRGRRSMTDSIRAADRQINERSRGTRLRGPRRGLAST